MNIKIKFLDLLKKKLDKNNRSRSAKLRFAVSSENKFENPKKFNKKFQKIFRFGSYKCLKQNS